MKTCTRCGHILITAGCPECKRREARRREEDDDSLFTNPMFGFGGLDLTPDLSPGPDIGGFDGFGGGGGFSGGGGGGDF